MGKLQSHKKMIFLKVLQRFKNQHILFQNILHINKYVLKKYIIIYSRLNKEKNYIWIICKQKEQNEKQHSFLHSYQFLRQHPNNKCLMQKWLISARIHSCRLWVNKVKKSKNVIPTKTDEALHKIHIHREGYLL